MSELNCLEINAECGSVEIELTISEPAPIQVTFDLCNNGIPDDSSLVLGETSITAYRGDRGKIAYDHSQMPHAPANAQHNVNADWNATSGDAQILNKPALSSIITVKSGGPLGSGRAVIMDGGKAIYFDPSNEFHGGRFFGITKTAVGGPNLDVLVQTSGWFNASWLALTPDLPYYIGALGILSTTPPASGIVEIVGASIDINTIEINSNLFYITI